MSLIAGSYERFLFGYRHPDSLKNRVRPITITSLQPQKVNHAAIERHILLYWA